MATLTYNFKRVYVWEIPVRLFHWLTVISITILIVTGFVIADPPAIHSGAEAINSYWFGYVRVIHMITAYVLIAAIIVRVYWAFAGNQFANWRNFIPYTRKGFQNMWYVLKVDIFLMPDREHKLSNISIGHNYFASFSYFIMFLVFVFQAITGLALMSDNSSWWFPKLFHWIVPFMGGEIAVRYFHHFLIWIFLAFIVVHVYLVFYHDYLEARGEASAMISGFKFIRAERVKISEQEIIEKTKKQMWEGKKAVKQTSTEEKQDTSPE